MNEFNINFDWSQFGSKSIDQIASNYFDIERFDDETDSELRRRIVGKFMRFQNSNGSFYDLVHRAEQAILDGTPVGCNFVAIRRQVGLGLIAKNKTGNWLTRLKTACKAFWSCL